MLNGLASGAALLGALLLAGSAAAPAPFAPPRSSEEPVDFERDVGRDDGMSQRAHRDPSHAGLGIRA